ncbi:hypothetical protein LTR91_020572 [Friedmanniomyces endolithicus]|uniref:Uncharacterized protein n=1 Tax=Friedmanniomyces endolithicus TaxID=329885 RepID=A0AAN6K0Y6_9PEZI|nr:hypothetical protein LTR94_019859 [Friedmanniomyces endolithicus]KAK0774366.1 hypothetical protein LTR38_016253 [Friedmanniomyces endolithicus]KAK0783619.1 hypothetical protein LTR75_014085 [Friedmanniomyces endolithicus]KAK0791808.1 hypothetical protein LTR59_008744 [Friedmanniomyces endolithicus]KAK0834186.1 hypothetical protein LTR03_014518 [Friedmanniomyces endolithicus]
MCNDRSLHGCTLRLCSRRKHRCHYYAELIVLQRLRLSVVEKHFEGSALSKDVTKLWQSTVAHWLISKPSSRRGQPETLVMNFLARLSVPFLSFMIMNNHASLPSNSSFRLSQRISTSQPYPNSNTLHTFQTQPPTPKLRKQLMPPPPPPAMAQLELPPPAYTPTIERTIPYPPRTHDMQPALFRNAAGLREPVFVDVEAGGATGYHARRSAPACNTSGCARLILVFMGILGLVAVGMTVFRHHAAVAVR